MLSRILSRNKNKENGSQRSKKNRTGHDLIKTAEQSRNQDIMFKDSERELYRFDMPTQEKGMADLINEHERGTSFRHLFISGEEDETLESRQARLFRYQPIIKIGSVNLPRRVNLRLVKEVEELPLANVLQKKVKMDYILIKRVTFVLTPLSSLFDEYTDVYGTIIDRRMKRSQKRQNVKMSSNNDYKGDLSLDYSIPKESIDKISIAISLDLPIMNDGEQWAACQVEMVVEESDYPQRPSFKEVIGAAGMPESGLIRYPYDPTTKDLTIHNNHREKFRELYYDGDLIRESEAMKEKSAKKQYSKSTLAGQAQSQKSIQTSNPMPGMMAYNDWDAVRNRKVDRVPLDQLSEDPEAEGSINNSPPSIKSLPSLLEDDVDSGNFNVSKIKNLESTPRSAMKGSRILSPPPPFTENAMSEEMNEENFIENEKKLNKGKNVQFNNNLDRLF